MSKTVVILRGLPGAGKSTWIKNNLPSGAVVCSADKYWETPDGEYKFVQERIGEAHRWCQEMFARAIGAGEDLVVVDNTSITIREIQPYYNLAVTSGYTVRIVRLEVDPEVAVSRNIHGASRDVIMVRAKLLNLITLPWEEEIVTSQV